MDIKPQLAVMVENADGGGIQRVKFVRRLPSDSSVRESTKIILITSRETLRLRKIKVDLYIKD